jgi:hypothetical protein
MTDEISKFDAMKETIEQLRDEIKLKAHLGKAEAREELEKLDKKWDTFVADSKPITGEAGKTVKNVGTALGLAAEELKEGYERIRKLF